MNTEHVFEPADWVAPDLEEIIVREELAAVPGQVACPGPHTTSMTFAGSMAAPGPMGRPCRLCGAAL